MPWFTEAAAGIHSAIQFRMAYYLSPLAAPRHGLRLSLALAASVATLTLTGCGSTLDGPDMESSARPDSGPDGGAAGNSDAGKSDAGNSDAGGNLACEDDPDCASRCADGHCVAWSSEGVLVSLAAGGDAVYWTTAATEDVLGNPMDDATLWVADDPDGNPRALQVGELGWYPSIVAIQGDSVYLEADASGRTGTALRVDASTGETHTLDNPINGRIAGVQGGEVYLTGGALQSLDFDQSQDAFEVYRVANTPSAGAERVLSMPFFSRHFFFAGAESIYAVGLYGDQRGGLARIDLTREPTLEMLWDVDIVRVYGTTGGKLVYSTEARDDQELYASPLGPLRDEFTVVSVDSGGITNGVTSEGWVYMSHQRDGELVIQRTPTGAGRLPQELVTGRLQGVRSAHIAVLNDTLYWAPANADGPVDVFRTPLPPKPCDADEVCSQPGVLCSSDGECIPE